MSAVQSVCKEIPRIFPLFGPILISQYAQIANGAIDSIMAARLGSVELGSVAVGTALWMPVYLFTVGVLFGVLILISQHHGAGEKDAVNKTAQQGCWLGLLLGLISTGVIYLSSSRIDWFGASPELVEPSREYVRMVMLGLPLGAAAVSLRFFCEGRNIVFPVTAIAVIVVVLKAVLSYIFMFGHFGMPAMGIRGCGLGTALGMASFLLLLLGYIRFVSAASGKKFLASFSAPRWKEIKRIFMMGLPIGIGMTLEFLVSSVMVFFISATGVVAVAAHQAAFTCMVLFFATPVALSIAASIRIGNLQGEGKTDTLRISVLAIMALSAIIGVIFMIIMLGTVDELAAVFTQDRAVIPVAITLIQIAALFQTVDALQICLNGILRGAGDTTTPFLITAAVYWLLCLPLGYALSRGMLPFGLAPLPMELGVKGWWIALTVSIALVALLLAVRVRRTFWLQTPAAAKAPVAQQ